MFKRGVEMLGSFLAYIFSCFVTICEVIYDTACGSDVNPPKQTEIKIFSMLSNEMV